MSLRWNIATLANKLPGTCWPKLVSYALGDRRSPLQPQDRLCRPVAGCDSCYCGKRRSLGGDAT